MSTNDDSASRRGRRANEGEPDWRTPNRQRPGERWDQPSQGNRDNGGPHGGRDPQPQNTAYSGFTRPSYSQARQEPAPPPARPYDPPQQQPQGYYQDPAPRQDGQRPYADPQLPSYTPSSPYSSDAQPLAYGDSGRDDLFGRDQGYGHNSYGSQAGYQPEPYDQHASRTPLVQPAAPRDSDYYRQGSSPSEDYERGFGARIAQENGSSRFFLPEDQAQAPQQWAQNGYSSPASQTPADRGYAPRPAFPAPQYDDGGGQADSFGRDQYDQRFGSQQGWRDDHGFHDQTPGLPVPQALRGDELDEDFFGDEEDFEEDHGTGRKRSRIKLIGAALAAAVLAGGGAYYLKSMGGGEKATPFIRADDRPAKDLPGNPGGRQFANGEKSIYERLTPDGQTQVASFTPPPSPASQSFGSPANAAPSGGNSLEDRIEDALRRARGTGDAPTASATPGRPDQPTVVRSESYRPDGTRVESRPVIMPSFGNASQLPPPFGNAVAAQSAPSSAPVPAAPFRAAPIPSQPQMTPAMATPSRTARAAPPPQPVEPVSAPAGSFYVSLKSAPDEKAIQRDLSSLSDKYKSVLGDVQVTTKIADLGSKGVTYRAVAGPLGSRQEAMDLCQKIKGVGGDKACFVTN